MDSSRKTTNEPLESTAVFRYDKSIEFRLKRSGFLSFTWIMSHTGVHESQTVGDILRARRDACGLTIDDIADATLIRKAHIESLERNMCDATLESVYRENYLKNYSTYLGLPWEDVKRRYDREQERFCTQLREHNEQQPRQTIERKNFWVTARILRNAFFGTLLGGVFAYLGFLGFVTLHPPELIVYSPPDNLSSTTDKIIVSGKANYESGVLINGRTISKQKDGTFYQEIALKDGLNVIEVSAMKKYGQEAKVRRTVIVNRGETVRLERLEPLN